MSLLDITGLTLAEILGDFQLKFFAREHKLGNLFGGLTGYAGVIFFLIRSLTKGNVMYVNGMWDGLSGVLEAVAAYFILGERLVAFHQYIGLALIVFGLVLMKSAKIPYQ